MPSWIYGYKQFMFISVCFIYIIKANQELEGTTNHKEIHMETYAVVGLGYVGLGLAIAFSKKIKVI